MTDNNSGSSFVKELPLTNEILEEAIKRVEEYSMPKRHNEYYYIKRYLRLLQDYTEYVDVCIRENKVPETLGEFIARTKGNV